MIIVLEKQFDKLSKKIKERASSLFKRFGDYLKRLLFPLYLFPIKLVTYTSYYLIRFIIKFIFSLIKIIFEMITFPFKSLKNFLKSIVIIVIVLYLFASLFVIIDYLTKQYGWWANYGCAWNAESKLKDTVVRIVGGNMEGSGFFIADNQILTNFHVIDGEASPKIIFPDGKFVTPVRVIGDKNADLAVLFTEEKFPDLVMPLPDGTSFRENEPVLATGYPLGTDISGKATVLRGNFSDYRSSKKNPVGYIQTNISLVPGMSGGPLTNICGKVVGINTQGLAGLSLFILGQDARAGVPKFTDENVLKIQVDPTLSPEDAVSAFYTYLKARRMQDGFNLLSKKYLEKTNFEEWTARFTNVLDVDVIKVEKFEDSKDTVFVKFSTKNWIDGEAEMHFYEGTWQTVKEDGVYKMLKSKIEEVENPEWNWFYE